MKTLKKLTTGKEAKQAIRQHITEHLEDSYTTAKELEEQLNAMLDNRTPTIYHAGKKLASGGALLIANSDIEDFLLANNLTTLDKLKKYDAFDFYCHLIGRELQSFKNWYKLN